MELLPIDIWNIILEMFDNKSLNNISMVSKNIYKIIWNYLYTIGVKDIVIYFRTKNGDKIIYFIANGKYHSQINIIEETTTFLSKIKINYIITLKITFYNNFIFKKIFTDYQIWKQKLNNEKYIQKLISIQQNFNIKKESIQKHDYNNERILNDIFKDMYLIFEPNLKPNYKKYYYMERIKGKVDINEEEKEGRIIKRVTRIGKKLYDYNKRISIQGDEITSLFGIDGEKLRKNVEEEMFFY